MSVVLIGPNHCPQVNRDAREQTVESIWEITEHLNILYRENWTRLAEQEITRFQDRLVKKITEDMLENSQNTGTYTVNNANNPANAGPSTERKPPDYEWNFAKAFLYSLTVLTTIGKSRINMFPSDVYDKLRNHCIPLSTGFSFQPYILRLDSKNVV